MKSQLKDQGFCKVFARAVNEFDSAFSSTGVPSLVKKISNSNSCKMTVNCMRLAHFLSGN